MHMFTGCDQKQHGGSEGDAFLWADQNTGETFEIDRRTGHSRIQGLLRPSGDVPSNGLAPSRRTLRSTEPDSHESHRIPEWIQVALKVLSYCLPTIQYLGFLIYDSLTKFIPQQKKVFEACVRVWIDHYCWAPEQIDQTVVPSSPKVSIMEMVSQASEPRHTSFVNRTSGQQRWWAKLTGSSSLV